MKRALKFMGVLDVAPTAPQALNPFAEWTIHLGTTPIRLEVQEDWMVFYDKLTAEESFGPWLRKLFIEKKEWVAQITGIEQIGWMDQVQCRRQVRGCPGSATCT